MRHSAFTVADGRAVSSPHLDSSMVAMHYLHGIVPVMVVFYAPTHPGPRPHGREHRRRCAAIAAAYWRQKNAADYYDRDVHIRTCKHCLASTAGMASDLFKNR